GIRDRDVTGVQTCALPILNNESVLALAEHPNINAVKQVTSIDDLAYLVDHAPEGFKIYTGEDSQTLAAKAVGAAGTISVAAHLRSEERRVGKAGRLRE